MIKIKSFLLLTFTCSFLCCQTYDSPYETSLKKDIPWLVGSLGGTGAGLYLKGKKDKLTMTELEALRKDDIFFIDKWAGGNFSESASNLSDIPFYGSMAMPLALAFDKRANKHSGQLLLLYVESLATTASLYTLTAALVKRSRPLVYNTNVPTNQRLEANAQSSFYSGHVATTATAIFFAAKVYSDFHPDSNLRTVFWAIAATIPAAVGYLRIQAGKHYLTDVVLGYALGAAVGILVPELHKKKLNSVQLFPSGGRMPLGHEYAGVSLKFTLN